MNKPTSLILTALASSLLTIYIQGSIYRVIDDGSDDVVYGFPPPTTPAPRPVRPVPPRPSTPRQATPAPGTPSPVTPKPATALNDPQVSTLISAKIRANGLPNVLGNVLAAANAQVRHGDVDAATQAREFAQLGTMAAAVASMQVFEELHRHDPAEALRQAAEFYLEAPTRNGSPLMRLMQVSDDETLAQWIALGTVPEDEIARMMNNAGRRLARR